MSVILDLRQDFAQPLTTDYAIDNTMLQSVENTLVKGGDMTTTVTAQQAPKGLRLTISTRGKAIVECDRCLDDMEVDINTTNELAVLFADHYEDDAEVVYVEHGSKELDLWPFIYDYIVLSIPLTHSHPEGQCNPDMEQKLNQYMIRTSEEE